MPPKEKQWAIYVIAIPSVLLLCCFAAEYQDTEITFSEITYDVRTIKGAELNSPLRRIRNPAVSEGNLKRSENDEGENMVKIKESTKSSSNDSLKYYIGGGVLAAALVVLIILLYCFCCRSRSSKELPLEEPPQNLSLSQQVIEVDQPQIEDTMPISESLERPIILPQIITEPQITQVEVYPRDDGYDIIDTQPGKEIFTTERQPSLERPDLADKDSDASYDSTGRERYSRRQERQKHDNRLHASERENKEIPFPHSAEHRSKEPLYKATEHPNRHSFTQIEPHRDGPERKIQENPTLDSDSEVIPAIKTKLNTIEEAMSTIEKDLDKLKHLKEDLEHEMVSEIERTSSLDNRKNYSKQRNQPRKANSLQVNNRNPEIDKRKKLHSSRDSYYVEPYPKEVTHEFKKALSRKNDIEHNIYESHENLHHHSDSSKRKQDTNSELSTDSAPKQMKIKSKDSTEQTEMEMPPPLTSEAIPIPDPDYLTQSKEDIPSEYIKEENIAEKRPKVPPKPLIKRREFKGPYGMEDLDDMNNPLTLALRMKGRRPILDQEI